MKRLASGSLVGLSMFVAMNRNALAKDVCLTDSFTQQYVFRKVAKLTPGRAIPLTGLLVFESFFAPVEGSAVLNAAGTEARFGLFAHTLVFGAGGNNFTAEWTGDTTFAGNGFFDNDGTFASSGPISFSVIDCKTVAIP